MVRIRPAAAGTRGRIAGICDRNAAGRAGVMRWPVGKFAPLGKEFPNCPIPRYQIGISFHI
jgi:hypothetical protein